MTDFLHVPAQLVMVGAGGHARVLHALAIAAGHCWAGVCDPELRILGVPMWHGLPVLGDDEALNQLDPARFSLVNGIGQIVGGTQRQDVYERLRKLGFRFPALIHPTAWIAACASLAEGVQIMAGAIVQPGCAIGANSIVNTRASIDHDCEIGAHVHIAPGATLCGDVTVADGAFVGAGSTLVPGVRVGKNAVVGAGTVLTKTLQDGKKIVGKYARLLS